MFSPYPVVKKTHLEIPNLPNGKALIEEVSMSKCVSKIPEVTLPDSSK
jgi:hypothetical protein